MASAPKPLDPEEIDAQEFWRQYPHVLSNLSQEAAAPLEQPRPPASKRTCWPLEERESEGAHGASSELVDGFLFDQHQAASGVLLEEQDISESRLTGGQRATCLPHVECGREWREYEAVPPLPFFPDPFATVADATAPPVPPPRKPFPNSFSASTQVAPRPPLVAAPAICGRARSCSWPASHDLAAADWSVALRRDALLVASEGQPRTAVGQCSLPAAEVAAAPDQHPANRFSLPPWGGMDPTLRAGADICMQETREDLFSCGEETLISGVGVSSMVETYCRAGPVAADSCHQELRPAAHGVMEGRLPLLPPFPRDTGNRNPPLLLSNGSGVCEGGGADRFCPMADSGLLDTMTATTLTAPSFPELEGGLVYEQSQVTKSTELRGGAMSKEAAAASSEQPPRLTGWASSSSQVLSSPSVSSSAANLATEGQSDHADGLSHPPWMFAAAGPAARAGGGQALPVALPPGAAQDLASHGSSSRREMDEFAEGLGALLDFEEDLSAWELQAGRFSPCFGSVANRTGHHEQGAQPGTTLGGEELDDRAIGRTMPAGPPAFSEPMAAEEPPAVVSAAAAAATISLAQAPGAVGGKRPLLMQQARLPRRDRPPDISARLALLVQSQPAAGRGSSPGGSVRGGAGAPQLAAAASAAFDWLSSGEAGGASPPAGGAAGRRQPARHRATAAEARRCRERSIVSLAGGPQFRMEQLLSPRPTAPEFILISRYVEQTPGVARFASESFEARRQSSARLPPVLSSAAGNSLSFSSQEALQLRLVALAEAMAAGDHGLARVLMERLKQEANPVGDVMQRIVYYFADALQVRARGLGPHRRSLPPVCSQEEFAETLEDFSTSLPFVPFSMTANAHVCVARLRKFARVHVIDYEEWEGAQWPPFLRQLCAGGGGPRAVRITSLHVIGTPRETIKTGIPEDTARVIGRIFAALAAELGVALEYRQVALDMRSLSRGALGVADDEGVAVCCSLRLQKLFDGPEERLGMMSSRDVFIQRMRDLRPAVFTLTEISCDLSAPGLVPRFRAALDFFVAEFGANDAAFPRGSRRRLIFERDMMGRDLVSSIACEGPDRVLRWEGAEKLFCRVAAGGWALLPIPAGGELCTALSALLARFPPGWSLLTKSGTLEIVWKGTSICHFSAWV